MAVSATQETASALRLPRARDLRRQIADFESTPGRLLRWAAVDWMLILAAWLGMAALDNAVAALIGMLIVASRLQALGALLHDACHSRVSSRAWPLVEIVAGWPIASTIAAMRYHHLRHHRYSGTALDPYRNTWIDRGPAFRFILTLRGALLPVWWTLRAVVAPVAQYSPKVRRFYARAFLQDRGDSHLETSAEIEACMAADLRQLLAQLGLLATALVVDFPVVEFYLLPWIMAGILNARRVIVEHSFAASTNCARQTVYAATVDHDMGRLINAMLYPHNLGMHRAHHLYPTASFVHLPQLTAAVHKANS